MGRAFHAFPSMATPSGPCYQIRALGMHIFTNVVREYTHICQIVPLGRRAMPVRKVYFALSNHAHSHAGNLLRPFGNRVSVLKSFWLWTHEVPD
jgi:hypothetical protein